MSQMTVLRVNVPAMSTIGYVTGVDVDTGNLITVAGDHRPCRDLCELADADEQIVIDYDEWQVL